MLRTKLLFGALLCIAVLVGSGAPAHAQDDPYGSTSTTEPPEPGEPSCSLSVASGAPGTAVTATVSNVPVGDTVRILFDGDQVGSGSAEAEAVANSAGRVVLLGGTKVPAGSATTTVTVDFTVPSRPPGTYIVTAVSTTFTATCGPGEGGGFGVLSASEGTGSGSLPKTGVYVALFVAVGGALLVAGRGLLAESRRRRRRAERESARHHAGV